jgi:hypothetical protein
MMAARRRNTMKARGTAVALAALAITLAGCASRTVVVSGTPTPTNPPSSQPFSSGSSVTASGSVAPLTLASPAAPTPDTEQARTTEAAYIANSLLDLVTLPVGATHVSTPPAPALTAAPESEMTKRMAVAHTFYTVRGTIDSVMTFVQTHLPAGFTSNGGGSGGPPPMAYVNLYGTATLAFQAPWLTVSATQDGGLIGVRVDSQVIWLPVRTAAEFIPTTVQGATLVATGDSQDATNKTLNLSAKDARALAATINALPTATDAAHGCPGISSAITVTFASTRKIVVTDSLCGVYLDAGEGTQLPLLYTDDFQHDLNRLLGLPTYWPLSSPEPTVPPAAGSPAPSPSIMHFLCTPPGWSPLTATAQELQEYGYPPRPDAAHNQGWLQAIKAAGPPYTCPSAAASS